MTEWIIYSIGFTAQLLFSARLVVQWISSERQKKVITPASFWAHSLMASFLLFIYGYLRKDFSIMLGQSLTYFIYIRNLNIQGYWQKMNIILRYFLLVFPLLVLTYYFNNGKFDIDILLAPGNIPPWLLILGITGQAVFTARFILQWIYAEKTMRSELPPVFWYWSISGSALIITYAILRKDPVLIVGQLTGFIVYSRNIMLLRTHA